MSENESTDVLKGNTVEVYRLAKKPIGIRELQRELKFSSPSVAQYHLTRLERAGFVKKEAGSYVVNKVVLESCVKISRFLIPKYLFYSVFAALILLIELIILKPDVITREYYFSTFATAIFLVIFSYETVKVWLKGAL